MTALTAPPDVVADQLHRDEIVLQTASGYAAVWPDLLATTSGRVVIATDQRILVFCSNYWRPGLPTSLLSAHRYGSTLIAGCAWSLRIGDEHIVVHLHQLGRARRIVELAGLAEAESGRASR
jgi:hypothetical protein